ncbi:23S rRNA (guanosine(2251)-2'-O)-methyltransferase RlmB [bacterium]|nr:23S rRNA (guanosine(2251)-2'-O)-methyltransferase RlmB [bacterium]
MTTSYVYGKNAILEWLASGMKAERIWLADELNPQASGKITALARSAGITVTRTARHELTRLVKHDNHQGVAAAVNLPPYASLHDIFTRAAGRKEEPLIAVLDGIQDPNNLGAIIRSAEGAGFHGVIIPRDNAAGLSPAVFKTSAGAAAHLPLVQVTNVSRILKALKDKGIWITGASEKAPRPYTDIDFSGPAAVVMGSEGKGMRRLTAEACDYLVSIPMHGAVASLNVSVAAALLFFEMRRQREALK